MNTVVAVSTRTFFASHGRLPRGSGCWGFEIAQVEGGSGEQVWFFGSYGEALKQAKAKAKELGAQRNLRHLFVMVLS